MFKKVWQIYTWTFLILLYLKFLFACRSTNKNFKYVIETRNLTALALALLSSFVTHFNMGFSVNGMDEVHKVHLTSWEVGTREVNKGRLKLVEQILGNACDPHICLILTCFRLQRIIIGTIYMTNSRV